MIPVKNGLLVLAMATFSVAAFGQSKYGANPADSIECVKSLSLMQTFMKQKQYVEAYTPWNTAFETCPGASKNIYIYGVRIFKDKYKQSKDAAFRKSMVDSIKYVYDQRIVNFGQECYVLGRKGLDMQAYDKDDLEGIYSTLKAAVDGCGAKSEAAVLSAYYKSLYDMWKVGKAEQETVLLEYVRLSKMVDENLAKYCGSDDVGEDDEDADDKTTKKCDKYSTAAKNLTEIFITVAECPEIEVLLTKMVGDKAGDVEVCQTALSILNKKGCDESEIYRQVAECVHNANPTHESAYALAMIYAKKRSYSEALKFMKQALELVGNGSDKEKYLEKAGQIASAMGSVGQTKSYANQLIQVNPNNGEAYILIGNSIAALIGKCDEDVQNWAVNWLAYDYYSRAKNADPSVASKAQQRMNSCAARFPEKSEAFFYELTEGMTIKVTCGGLNESTTVRTK